MQRAIELNGVAVESNKAAFALGRLAAADPAACRELLHEPDPALAHPETVDELIERSAQFLAAYQDAAYAERYRRRIADVRAREEAVSGAAGGLPLTRAVATQLRKLMAYKDEYEVAGSTPTASSRSASPSSSRASRRSSSTWRRRRS
jgi:indolepyruvate ferredoxin oxidoreductase